MVDCFLCTFGLRACHACVTHAFFHVVVREGKWVETSTTSSYRAHYGEIHPGGPQIRGRCCGRRADGRFFGVIASEHEIDILDVLLLFLEESGSLARAFLYPVMNPVLGVIGYFLSLLLPTNYPLYCRFPFISSNA